MSDSLPLHGLQHTRLPCPSLSPGVCSNSCPSSWWCHLTHLLLCHAFFLFIVYRQLESQSGGPCDGWMVVLEAYLPWLGFFFDRAGILQASPPASLHPGYSYRRAMLLGTLALTTYGWEHPFFSWARECGKKWVLQSETQAIVRWLKEDSKGKNIFPTWNICPAKLGFSCICM